jgi:hypothetical protein
MGCGATKLTTKAGMMLPEFNQDGNLPKGMHHTTEAEMFARFTTT